MSLRTIFTSLPFLWNYASALPAGPGPWANVTTNGTSSVVHSSPEVGIAASYNLIDTYDSSNWLNKFDVQAIPDPTHGFVNYVSLGEAQQLGLLRNQGNQVYMGVDTWSYLDPNGAGRKSTRLQSKAAYSRGLIIADFAHVPGSNCGSWPAFWMFGPNWPNQGELDIIEGVHLNTYNQISLHTSPGCVPAVGDGGETGRRVSYSDCGEAGGYNGCGVMSQNPVSYGTAFNANGGGVYAALWTSSGIKVWYFATRDVPSNIKDGNPDPNSWGTPTANFGGGCDYNSKFSNMNIIFDITFCGDWAGGVWGQSSCSQMNPSCNAYVASQPQSFWDSYWLVNSIKVYSV